VIVANNAEIMAALCRIPGSLDLSSETCPNGHSPNQVNCPECEKARDLFAKEIDALVRQAGFEE